jgi:2-haloacid dehalogenase
MGAYVDFWQITGDGLNYALAAHGVDDRALRDELMELYLDLDAYPEVAETLVRLRAGGQSTVLLSNGAPNMLLAATTSAGIDGLLDPILSVDEIGVYKPDPRAYQLAVDRLGVPAEQICYLSANAWDARGAAHFGFNVAWINRYGQVPERQAGKPAAMIETLADVPALLGL